MEGDGELVVVVWVGETRPRWGLIGQMADGAWNGWERT